MFSSVWEFVTTMLSPGSPGFVLACLAIDVLVGWLVESGARKRQAAVVVGFLLFLQFGLGVPLAQWVAAHPWWTLGLAGGYLAPCGMAVAALKWVMKCHSDDAKIWDCWYEYANCHGLNPANYETMADDVRNDFNQYVASQAARHGFDVEADFYKHRGVAIQWVAYWPGVLLYTVVNDPLRKGARYIVALMAGTMQRIASFHNGRRAVLLKPRDKVSV